MNRTACLNPYMFDVQVRHRQQRLVSRGRSCWTSEGFLVPECIGGCEGHPAHRHSSPSREGYGLHDIQRGTESETHSPEGQVAGF